MKNRRLIAILLSVLLVVSMFINRVPAVSATSYNEPLPDGVYNIVSYLDQTKVVDISGMGTNNCINVQLWDRNYCAAQDFQLIRHPAGWYLIVNVHSWKALDVAGGVAAMGQNVWQYEINYSLAQRWYLEDAGDGWFFIRSALGYYLDVSGACTANGTNIQIWESNKCGAQKYRFEEKNSYSTKVSEFLGRPEHKNDAVWGYSQRPTLASPTGIGCYAYAADFVKYVFNKSTPRSGTYFTNINSIKAGDVICLNSPHWFVVIERYSDGRLMVAEGNVNNGKVRISDNVYKIQNGQLYSWGSKVTTFNCGYHFK